MFRRTASMIRLRRHGQSRPWLACLLVVALLVAQGAGLAHQLLHGGIAAVAQANDKSCPVWSPAMPADGHSCVLYDAATLGDGPPSAAALPAGLPAEHAAVAAPAPGLLHLAPPRRFLPRAPPGADRLA